jgi:hypothetical protein
MSKLPGLAVYNWVHLDLIHAGRVCVPGQGRLAARLLQKGHDGSGRMCVEPRGIAVIEADGATFILAHV